MVAIDEIPIDDLCREMRFEWTAADQRRLEHELRPYTEALESYLASGQPIPSHIENASSVCVPITEITDPYALYEEASGDVGQESFEVREFDRYWVTVHHSDVPVVILLVKQAPAPPLAALSRLVNESAAELGETVGNPYLQYNMPGFGWQLHTDDDYEGVSTRVHLPITTNDASIFAWAPTVDSPRDQWLLSLHLDQGTVYATRVDVPHTAINGHQTEGRLHLILDVGAAEPDGLLAVDAASVPAPVSA